MGVLLWASGVVNTKKRDLSLSPTIGLSALGGEIGKKPNLNFNESREERRPAYEREDVFAQSALLKLPLSLSLFNPHPFSLLSTSILVLEELHSTTLYL